MCGQTMALNASVTSGHTSHTLNYVFESLTFICVRLTVSVLYAKITDKLLHLSELISSVL